MDTHTYVFGCIYAYIHTQINTNIHTYVHSHLRICMCVLVSLQLCFQKFSLKSLIDKLHPTTMGTLMLPPLATLATLSAALMTHVLPFTQILQWNA